MQKCMENLDWEGQYPFIKGIPDICGNRAGAVLRLGIPVSHDMGRRLAEPDYRVHFSDLRPEGKESECKPHR